nr:MAG TPA: hypothetical protein [Caudoviricetes sp.]DAT63928.1 MAG TPA: hypothetical protein [Caudoviricetes sp.]
MSTLLCKKSQLFFFLYLKTLYISVFSLFVSFYYSFLLTFLIH